jgi:hypothetical protein
MVEDISTDRPAEGSDTLRQQLRVRGRNLLKDGAPPRVSIGGRPVGVLRATQNELVLAPGADQFAGQMSLAHDPRAPTELWFDETAAPAAEQPS